MNNPHELPAPPMDESVLRVQALAADLAYGALKQFWNAELPTGTSNADALGAFLVRKWNNNYPAWDLLISFGYLRREDRYGSPRFILTQKAFDLLETIPPGTKVFISYERSKSSAFALALHYRLTSLGVEAFLDKEIDLGDEWHARLKEKIYAFDYFIPLLSPDTLGSENVRKEIKWAYESHRACIPVWHSGFSSEAHLIANNDLEEPVKKYLLAKNACIVEGKEKAAIYDQAINNIINQLGYV